MRTKFRTLQKAARGSSLALLVALASSPVTAELLPFLNRQNARAAVDFSTRAVFNEIDNGSVLALGLDTHRVFSRSASDIATLTLQPYITVADTSPGLKNSGTDAAGRNTYIDWRFSNLNFRLSPRGGANLRIGHFEIPFGLEQVIQTAGTVNDMNARFNSGRKADWGASLNGQAHNFEYELAWMTGPRSSSGFLTGRIGRSRDNDWWLGVSGLNGETNTPARGTNETVERSRWGIDGGLHLMSGVHVLADLATGRDNGERVTHALLETGYRNRTEAHLTYAQFRISRFKDSSSNIDTDSITLGYRFEPGSGLTTGLEYRYCLQNTLAPNQFTAQLRLRI